MKVGDLVHIKEDHLREQIGVIIDTIQMEDGFWRFEVMFEQGPFWYTDLELEVLSESR